MRPFFVLTMLVLTATSPALQDKRVPPANANGHPAQTTTVCGTVYGAGVDETAQGLTVTLDVGGLTGNLPRTLLTRGHAVPFLFVTLPAGYSPSEVQQEPILKRDVPKDFILKNVCVSGTAEMFKKCCTVVLQDAASIRVTEPPPMANAHWSWEAGVQEPTLLRPTKPRYTAEAMRAKVSGTVVLLAVVQPDGQPHDIRVAQPVGFGLDEAAVDSLKQWRFAPGTLNGEPVAVMVVVQMLFQLRSER